MRERVEMSAVVDDGPELVRYAESLRSLVDLSVSRPLRVVVSPGAEVAAATVPTVLGTAGGLPELPVELVVLPVRAGVTQGERLDDLRAVVVEHDADAGLAFDADPERCAVVDEHGDPVHPSVVTVLVGLREAARARTAERDLTVVHDTAASRAVPDLLAAAGAHVVQAGSAGLQDALREHDAAFAASSDGRYLFRDLPYADTALLAACHVLAALGEQDHPLSVLGEIYRPYARTELTCAAHPSSDAATARVADAYVTRQGAGPVDVDERDGLLVSHWADHPQWWFVVEPSGPQEVRLVVEAADDDIMDKVRDDVLALIGQEQA